MCDGCYSGCCTLPVEAGPADIIRLELATEEEMALSPKKVAKRLEREGMIQMFRAKTQLFILQQQNGDDCIFLDKNRMCTVYLKRPEVCRSFPKIGPRPGFCPCKPKRPE
jgi:Fe-S-cluster containining protein